MSELAGSVERLGKSATDYHKLLARLRCEGLKKKHIKSLKKNSQIPARIKGLS